MAQPLTIALTKGRILKETLPLFKKADIFPLEDPASSRKLVFETNHGSVRLVILRGADVPTYVEYGAADLGVCGKDMLLEQGSEAIYEPLDLKIARCRLMTAGLANAPVVNGRIRVATKFVNVAKQYFASQGVQADIIKLYGGMELAPIMGLSDQIVDIVDTGNTLKANGLVPLQLIAQVSSRLIVNKASMKTKHQPIEDIIRSLTDAVDNMPH